MKIGIIGSGTMGGGIAQAFATSDGFSVVLCSMRESSVGKARDLIAKKLGKAVEKGKLEAAKAESILSRISSGMLKDAKDCDLIIEAAQEDMATKKKLFGELQNICRPDAIFASNTSSLSITEMSQGLDRAVVGMHFFNPAEVMKLVEVISGVRTLPATVAKVKEIAEKIGKTPVEVKEAAGFVVNRILIPLINEAVVVLAEGTASAEDIDTAMKLGANHPMGPLALGDLIGLDVCLAIMEVLHNETGEDKYRPHPLLRKMVRAGLLGRKSGKGFFDYSK